MVVSELTASAAAMKSLGNTGIHHDTTQDLDSTSPLTNRAAQSPIPYVRSFQDSPVAWQPLNQETVERAKAQGKLIFLHIGYKACHYCRLMSTESFANLDCAAVLNDAFIPIVIDRESRPDLDTIYLNYVQAITNASGWPLNLFLTPELEPVFGGTYWPGPNVSRPLHAGNPDLVLAFLTIIKRVRDCWKDKEARCRKEAIEVVAKLSEFVAEGTLGTRVIAQPQPIAHPDWPADAPLSTQVAHNAKKSSAAMSSELDLDQLEEAYTHIAGTFDPVYGGFGLSPKFLTPPKLEFLLGLQECPRPVRDIVGEAECAHATGMVVATLRQIRNGALHDHVGGATGFARCSVTPDWSIPNFEKLMVDNAQLLSLYLSAWRRVGGQSTSEFYDVVVQLADYLTCAPMLRSDGLLVSSEAADSRVRKGDGEFKEGAYYVWTRREFNSVIGAADQDASRVVAAHWGVLEDGNVDEKHDNNDDFIKQNILRLVKSPVELSNIFCISIEKVEQYIRIAQSALRTRREAERERPEVDDKSVVGSNGLAISALSKAAAFLKTVNAALSARCLAVASGIASFIQEKLWDADKRILYRIWTGARHIEGFADDYAYMIQGLLDLFDVDQDEALLEFAEILQKAQNSHFYDHGGAGGAGGGFFSTMVDSPFTILRIKDGMDTSLPSTNGVSVSNLYRLAAIVDDDNDDNDDDDDEDEDDAFEALARKTLDAFEPEILQYPWLFPGLLAGVVTARLGKWAEK